MPPHSTKDEMEDVEVQDAPAQDIKKEEDDVDMGDAGVKGEGETVMEDDNDEEEEIEHKEIEDIKKDAADLFDNYDDFEDFGGDFNENDFDAMIKEEIPTGHGSDYSDEGVMYAFYSRLFPYTSFFHWLNHSPKPTLDFLHREIAFVLRSDAMVRYLSFKNAEEFRKKVLSMNPQRFEIGPVYSACPADKKTTHPSKFMPLEKELVFDIDMTDYDEIRTCCSGASICHKCWGFITVAIRVLDAALRDDFGYEHILWVYSGRRGAHAWVCDKRARQLDDPRRKAITSYLNVIIGGAQTSKKVNLRRPLHPHLQRSLDLLKGHFERMILEEQDPWVGEDKVEKLLKLLPDRNLNKALKEKWDADLDSSSKSKWLDIDSLARKGVSKNLDGKALLEAKQDIVLEYLYPRLDANVSLKRNHLLKSPFVVHPGTGRVCVPIDISRLEEFDPFTVPTVTQLLDEIDKWEDSQRKIKKEEPEVAESEEKKPVSRIQDWEKTSLKPYVELFRTFVNGLMKEENKLKRERDDDVKMEF